METVKVFELLSCSLSVVHGNLSQGIFNFSLKKKCSRVDSSAWSGSRCLPPSLLTQKLKLDVSSQMNTFKAFGTPHPSRFLSVCSVLAHVFFCYVLLDKTKYLFCSLVSTDFTLVSLCLCALYDFLSSLSDLLFFFFFYTFT